jgi:hypothetical protein
MKTQFFLKAAVLGLATAFFFGQTEAQTTNSPVAGSAYQGSAYAGTASTNNQVVYQDVTVYLNLQNVVEFVVNQNWAELVFDTYDKYNNGTNVTVSNQFTVSSNLPFELSVAASSNSFSDGNGHTIPAADINVLASTSDFTGTAAGVTQSFTPIGAGANLSTTDTKIADASVALNDKITIKYTATGGKDFLKPAGIYSDVVRYTVTQK